ncbi:helicase-related protein [Priestia megaterium]
MSVIYGSMPPETRRKQIEQFINRETTVIVSTDAIGMGLNLPIRRIVLLENMKFDGQNGDY